MAMPGETIHLGAPSVCPDCNTYCNERVLRSAAGWYIGTVCDCGPYSRESEYYATEKEAKKAFRTNTIKYREANFNG